jgi:hypothetical protein
MLQASARNRGSIEETAQRIVIRRGKTLTLVEMRGQHVAGNQHASLGLAQRAVLGSGRSR